MRWTGWLVVVVMAMSAATAAACLWDRDTLRMERAGLPKVAEAINGKFEVRSRLYHERRVAECELRIKKDPADLAAYDDLGVSLEKLGEVKRAIEVMLAKEKVATGKYETYSNLGTFYLFDGQLELAIEYIRKALVINPEAHFGREEYQLKLAEFLLAVKKDPSVRDQGDFLGLGEKLKEKRQFSRGPERLKDFDLKPNVVDGIVGMIRFGTTTSPDLYFTLGEVLAVRGDLNLAVRAYRRALAVGHPRPELVKEAMEDALGYIEDKTDVDPAVMDREVAEAAEFVKAWQAREEEILRAGGNPDDETAFVEFRKKYGRSDEAITVGWFERTWHKGRIYQSELAWAAGVLAIGSAVVGLMVRLRKRRARIAATARAA